MPPSARWHLEHHHDIRYVDDAIVIHVVSSAVSLVTLLGAEMPEDAGHEAHLDEER